MVWIDGRDKRIGEGDGRGRWMNDLMRGEMDG